MVMDRSRKALSPLHPSRDPEWKQKGGWLTPSARHGRSPRILSSAFRVSRRRGGKQSGERFAQVVFWGKFPLVVYSIHSCSRNSLEAVDATVDAVGG